MSDKATRKYFENLPYGKESKASEIHGKHNQATINKHIMSLVRNYDESMATGNKERAGYFDAAVRNLHHRLENLKAIKEEFALNYGGGTGGKNLFSNYTDLTWERAFFTEKGEILIGEGMEPLCVVKDDKGKDIVKKIEDITENWVLKGTGEADFMARHQSAVRQSNSLGKPLDFDVDWEVSKMLENEDAWKSFATDKIGGRYFVNDYVEENEEAIRSGEISGEALHPDSFNPAFDNRLHRYFANRLRKAFSSVEDGQQEQRDSRIQATIATDEANRPVNTKTAEEHYRDMMESTMSEFEKLRQKKEKL